MTNAACDCSMGPTRANGRSAMTYEEIAERATEDAAFREGLIAAALVCRSQGGNSTMPPCPSSIAAIYIERLAGGEMP